MFFPNETHCSAIKANPSKGWELCNAACKLTIINDCLPVSLLLLKYFSPTASLLCAGILPFFFFKWAVIDIYCENKQKCQALYLQPYSYLCLQSSFHVSTVKRSLKVSRIFYTFAETFKCSWCQQRQADSHALERQFVVVRCGEAHAQTHLHFL